MPATKHGNIIQARLLVRPEVVALFELLIDDHDCVVLPPLLGAMSRHGGTVGGRAQKSLRFIDVPVSRMLPEDVTRTLQARRNTVISCDWDVCPMSDLPRVDAILAVARCKEAPPSALRTTGGHVMACHVFKRDTPVCAPAQAGLAHLRAVVQGPLTLAQVEMQAPQVAVATQSLPPTASFAEAAALSPPSATSLAVQQAVGTRQLRQRQALPPPPPRSAALSLPPPPSRPAAQALPPPPCPPAPVLAHRLQIPPPWCPSWPRGLGGMLLGAQPPPQRRRRPYPRPQSPMGRRCTPQWSLQRGKRRCQKWKP